MSTIGAARIIVERVPLGLDIAQLRAAYERHVRHLPKVDQSFMYGGWSVTSRSGDHRDGWYQGHRAFERQGERWTRRDDLSRAEWDHVTPTAACTGYIATALDAIRAYGFRIFRVRFALLRAGGRSAWHRDGLDGEYSVRLHVPVITNQGCRFITRHGGVHMPADGAGYLVNVAQLHQIINSGTEDRVHIFMPIWDVAGVSEHFRLPEDAAAVVAELESAPAAPTPPA